jgi:uncharacterized protein YceH (UPF0502 family)
MPFDLNAIAARVLGCLIEKHLSTPDVYPLSLNALTNACNQKSNRDPLMALDETTVVRALDELRDRKLACLVSLAGSRVVKYEHQAIERLHLEKAQLALLCELLVRGPQTLAELRSHAERLLPALDAAAAEQHVRDLATRAEPLLMLLPRQPGRKEQRYAHLLCGEIKIEETPSVPLEPARLVVQAEHERLAKLEGEVAALRATVEQLQQQLADLRRQLE